MVYFVAVLLGLWCVFALVNSLFGWRLLVSLVLGVSWLVCCYCSLCGVKNRGPKIVKNGPRVWAFCKIEFPGIQKPVQILAQKSGFFRNPGNRGVGVIWLVCRVFLMVVCFAVCLFYICCWLLCSVLVLCLGVGCVWFSFCLAGGVMQVKRTGLIKRWGWCFVFYSTYNKIRWNINKNWVI